MVCADECRLRYRGDCIADVFVRVPYVGVVRVVVNVRDGDVVDGGIADVDAVHVLAARVIRRHVHFPWAQWEPSHISRASVAHRHGKIEARPSHKDDQRRRIDGTHRDGSGHPAPIAPEPHPPAVVRRRVTPGRIVDPGPAPRRNPYPMAVTIWSPSPGDSRNPYITIARMGAPLTVVVQILIAD